MTDLMPQADEPKVEVCPRCGQLNERDVRDPHICVECAKAENSRITHYRQHQGDWMAVAKESGIELWQQQPGETQWEFTVWTAYRDSYPGRKPTYASVAQQLNTTANSVRKIAQRWSFQMRMQAWMKHCDDVTLLQRRNEILSMNADHIDMAQKLRNKLNVAISAIVPEDLKPGEIATLMKLSADLERKAQVDSIAQEELRHDMLVDTDNPELRKSQTKQSDLSEIIGILANTGALGELGQIGVRTTQEVVVIDKSGSSAQVTRDGGATHNDD